MGDIADSMFQSIADDFYIPTRRSPLRCKHCRKRGLVWGQHKSGKWWLMVRDGRWHNCTEREEE